MKSPYAVSCANNRFTILLDGDPLLGPIKPEVKFEADGAYEATPQLKLLSHYEADKSGTSGDCTDHTLVYEDEKGETKLTIIIEAYAHALLCRVNLVCAHKNFNDSSRYLASVGGITLRDEGFDAPEGYMASYQFQRWWTQPAFGSNPAEMPDHTISLLWKLGGVYHHLLPVCGDVLRTELAGRDGGIDIRLSAYNYGHNNLETVSFALASGGDPYELPLTTAALGLQARGSAAGLRSAKAYPDVLEYLGWCTWDAFYDDVTEQGITDKLEEFKRHELPVKWLMIDCGWSETKEGKLQSFAENRDKFPGGLRPLIERAKTDYGLNWVGVWQAFTGFWEGIDPDGRLAVEMKDHLYRTNHGKLLPFPDVAKGFGFWNAWHTYLRRQGVDFIKVDNQGSLVLYFRNNLPIGTAALGAHAALDASAGTHFGMRMINCMGMATENIWSRPGSSVSRSSGDFFPQIEDHFKLHALQNPYNCYYHGAFYHGDWDMWWTKHEYARNHSVLRAVSGGPVYVSDKVGATDPEMLRPLILVDGRVLRCDGPGLPTEDCLLTDPNQAETPLKIWNRAGAAGVVGAFNLNREKKKVRGGMRPSDVPGLAGDRFAVFDYYARTVVSIARDEAIALELDNDELAYYVIAPYESGLAVIGLSDKYVSPAAIEAVERRGELTIVRLKQGGVFAFAANVPPVRALVNGGEAAVRRENGFYSIDCSAYACALTIELQTNEWEGDLDHVG
ncbi:hypothetical protein GZH47_31980 (plasmid) [Paenibacillus rhizovicinus]|uniref:Alpha-galactosidase n=1 Tax=Paenibacillus rhizovicinus TaxID=2704463 RepID=A0A6C0PAW1_9BACL|nr:Sip1-related alpha-galactosidase [Paenibacillus rhizovicinus]QHW35511.1 hypothetical protein GZH47_31980 [Paenibacillus rhizovicinus]